jgi:hypothetical protein
MAVDDGGSFITELDHLVMPVRSGARHKDERLGQVRRDHGRLMDVVSSFGEKVGIMIDNQRSDFMTAYEHHIIDVQRELQSLREKVAVIESDATLKAKLDTLDSNQKKYKEEALHLDAEMLDLRKKLRKLVSILHNVERERDWYLQRLRQAKRRYNMLLHERIKHGGEGLDATSLYSNSNDSQYTLQILRSSGVTADEVKARVKGVYSVSRDPALLQTLPHIVPRSGKNRYEDEGVPVFKTATTNSSKNFTRSARERKALGELVALKARQEAIRDFVSYCASSCDKGPWARVPRRPLQELLAVCAEVAEEPDVEASEQERLLLAFELAALPDTYFAISDFLAAGRDMESAVLRRSKSSLDWGDGENAFTAGEFSDGFFVSGTEEGQQDPFVSNEDGCAAAALEFTSLTDDKPEEGGLTTLRIDPELLDYLRRAQTLRDEHASAEGDNFMQFD